MQLRKRKTSYGRLSHSLVSTMNFKNIRWGVNWIHVTEGRDQWQALVNTVMNILEFLEWLRDCTYVCFSRRTQLHRVGESLWLYSLLHLHILKLTKTSLAVLLGMCGKCSRLHYR
jgi:hypothetical protein